MLVLSLRLLDAKNKPSRLILQASTGSLLLNGPGLLQVFCLFGFHCCCSFIVVDSLIVVVVEDIVVDFPIVVVVEDIVVDSLPPSPFIRSDSCDEWGARDTPSPPPFPSPPDDAGRMKDILKTGDYYRFKLDLKILQGSILLIQV